MLIDSQIQEDVRAALRRDPRIKHPELIAGSVDEIGTVVLRGAVESLPERLAAAHDARHVEGVFDGIVDHVKGHPPVAHRRPDDEIRAAALQRLTADARIRSTHIHDIPAQPAESSIDRLVSLLEPFSRVIQPKLYGLDHLPADGSLLVGNHTIYGLLDVPFMMAEVWKHRRLAIRSHGEHAHYAVPIWRDLLTAGGMVRGTRDSVRALTRRAEAAISDIRRNREERKFD